MTDFFHDLTRLFVIVRDQLRGLGSTVVRSSSPGIRASVGLSKCMRLYEAPKRLVVVKILRETVYVI